MPCRRALIRSAGAAGVLSRREAKLAMFGPLLFAAVFVTAAAVPAHAVTNPNISVIGQPLVRWTDDAGDPAAKRLGFEAGEFEFVFDAPLNPYANAWVTLAMTDEGMELEEGWFSLDRLLPGGLAIKGGKYRVGFGKLNPVHPHAVPFAGRPHVLTEFLPGEESFNETGLQISQRLALPGDVALTLSADLLAGDSFRIPREATTDPEDPLNGPFGDREDEPHPATLGRIALFVPIDDRSGVEFGASAARGTNNVAAGTRTVVYGGDVRAKFWSGPQSYLVLHVELLGMDRASASWDEFADAYRRSTGVPTGGFAFADWNLSPRWNFGIGFEEWGHAGAESAIDQAWRAFGGYSLMEETTAFRLDYEYRQPHLQLEPRPDPVNTVTLRVIFSMGPHKAHQF